MPAPIAHAPAELARLEAASGLQLLGFVAAGAPATLVPILGAARPQARARELVGRLNGRTLGQVAAPAPVSTE